MTETDLAELGALALGMQDSTEMRVARCTLLLPMVCGVLVRSEESPEGCIALGVLELPM